MWGHAHTCGCPICLSFGRVFPLIFEGSRYPGFVPLAGGHVRVLEGELRDALAACAAQGRQVAPSGNPGGPPQPPETATPPAAPGQDQKDVLGEGIASTSQAAEPQKEPQEEPQQEPSREGDASASHASEPPTAQQSVQCLYPKSKPPEPEHVGSQGPVKVEPGASPEQLVDGCDPEVEEGRKKPKQKDPSKKSKNKDKNKTGSEEKKPRKADRRTRSRSRRRRRSTGDRRSPSQRSDRQRKQRDRGEEGSPRSARGSDGKRHSDRAAGPRSPLRPRSPPYPPRPRSPPGPPPVRREERGQGWQGVIPYSSHPRWSSGTNKGVTKRAKQELHDRRRRWG
eukprot:s4239_g1.t1